MPKQSRKTWTVSDLRSVPPGTFQYCVRCGGEYSATHGDYFMSLDDQVLKCCGRPVRLVTATRVITEIDHNG